MALVASIGRVSPESSENYFTEENFQEIKKRVCTSCSRSTIQYESAICYSGVVKKNLNSNGESNVSNEVIK